MSSEYDEIQRAAKEREDIVAKYDLGREEGAQIDPWEDPAFEVYHVTDRFGFIHDKALPKNVDASEDKNKQVERERTTKWLKMIKAWDRYFPGEKLMRRVYKGVPDCLRGEVWSRLLNIPKVKAEQEGIYQRMRYRARTKSTSIRQIDLDVNRTYRNHIMFRERYGVKQQALFHVLAAYSVYNTEIGYCQGMSEVAALLLMYLNEEDAFWGLSQLFVSPRHLMHGSYMHGFPKLLRMQAHHDTVLRKFLPKVRRHLEKNDIYPSLYTIKWFLQCFLDRTPFTLTLRLWDIFMLDGELTLVAMAYCIVKIHRRQIMKMQMDEILTFFQSGLEKDFVYDSDTVIDQLQICMEELRKAKMSLPPKSKINEQPTLPFGLEIQPSVEQLIGRRTDETMDEHFRKNVQRPGGKAAYLRRKNTGGSMSGGANLLSTPEMSRSRAVDNRSLHSRISQYSLDEKSSYQETATNSRMSLTDFSAKNSAPSSRTSFGESSNMGSMSALEHVLNTPMDVDDVDADQTISTSPPESSPYYSSPLNSLSHQTRATSSSEIRPQTPTSGSEHPVKISYDRSPRPGSLSPRKAVTTSHHSGTPTPTKTDHHRNTNNATGSRSYEYDHTSQPSLRDSSPPRLTSATKKPPPVPQPPSSYEPSAQASSSHLKKPAPLETTSQSSSSYEASSHYSSSHGRRYASSGDPDADGSHRFYGNESMNDRHSTYNFYRGQTGSSISASKSEGFMSSIPGPEIMLANGHGGQQSAKMKVTKTENDIQRAGQQDRRRQQNVNFQNGFRGEVTRTGQTRAAPPRVMERTSHL